MNNSLPKNFAALASALLITTITSFAHAKGTCLWVRQINGFEPGPKNTLILDMTNRQKYEITFRGICNEIEFANRVSFPDSYAVNEFCEGDRVGFDNETCWSKSITLMTKH